MPGCLHGTCHQPWQCICHSGWAGKFCDKGESRAGCDTGRWHRRGQRGFTRAHPLCCALAEGLWLKPSTPCTDGRDGTASSHPDDAGLGCPGDGMSRRPLAVPVSTVRAA